MKTGTEWIRAEAELIEKIQRDETWYEGERRKCPVEPDDPAVKERVLEIVHEHIDEIEAEAEAGRNEQSIC